MPFSLRLGKRYYIWRCPLQEIDYQTVFYIKLVSWAEATHQTPSGCPLLEETNFFFELREAVLVEQTAARKELEELSPKKDPRAGRSGQGSRVPRGGKSPRKR